MRVTREFFIPEGSEHIKHEDLRADLYLYQGGVNDKSPCAMVFINKQQKPLWGSIVTGKQNSLVTLILQYSYI